MAKSRERFTVEQAKAYADDCRVSAMQADNVALQIMLNPMAETWDWVAADLANGS